VLLVGDSKSILIAEQDDVVRQLQRYFLESAGFVVEFVADGEDALATARRHLPSLIVSEILLPKIDGLSLCRRIRADELTQDIPIVIFSILNAAARAREAGAQAFLRKPLVESVFVSTIRSLSASKSSVTLEQPKWASQ
jgi:two-component system response regulator RpaA